MLILTLTISSFMSQVSSSSISGGYSAVFPLLVVSCFVSLMVSRSVVFYTEQRSRGDITAVPEVLCEPGMQGKPLVSTYDRTGEEGEDSDGGDEDGSDLFDDDRDNNGMPPAFGTPSGPGTRNCITNTVDITQADIQKAFADADSSSLRMTYGCAWPREDAVLNKGPLAHNDTSGDVAPSPSASNSGPSVSSKEPTFSRLDELLSIPTDSVTRSLKSPSYPTKTHRRTQSAPTMDPRLLLSQRLVRNDKTNRFESHSPDSSPNDRPSNSSSLLRVDSFGELRDHQPPLLEQARLRAASGQLMTAKEARKYRRSPSTPLPTNPTSPAWMESSSSGSLNGRRERFAQ